MLGIGSTLGAYRLLRRLGAGGMGEVWVGEHAMLGRLAAVKVLHPAFSSRPEIVARFFNEARAATAIADAGIVGVFDFGRHDDGEAYIVMELLDGESLEARLARKHTLDPSEAIRLVRQVASSLGAAHARGIVHRDLKPDNIFIVTDHEVPGGERTKILDFGIAKLAGDDVGVTTQTQAVMGTPAFMSPEQCRGAGKVDQRSDIYSLGCVLFVLVAGRPPFLADGSGELISMHLREAPPRLATLVSGIAPELDELVACCLAKDPAARYPSGRALAAALDELAARLPAITARPFVAPTLPAPTPTTLSSAAAQPTTATRRLGWRLAMIGSIAAVAGMIAFAALHGGATSAAIDATPALAPPVVPASPDAMIDAADIDAAIVDVTPADAAIAHVHHAPAHHTPSDAATTAISPPPPPPPPPVDAAPTDDFDQRLQQQRDRARRHSTTVEPVN